MYSKAVGGFADGFLVYKMVDHSASLKPTRIFSSQMSKGRFTSMPSEDSSCNCASSDIWLKRSFKFSAL